MLHNVIDRAVQVYGAAGLTDDTPLSLMYRTGTFRWGQGRTLLWGVALISRCRLVSLSHAARCARIYDGPDEVHIKNAAARVLMDYANGVTWDFGTR